MEDAEKQHRQSSFCVCSVHHHTARRPTPQPTITGTTGGILPSSIGSQHDRGLVWCGVCWCAWGKGNGGTTKEEAFLLHTLLSLPTSKRRPLLQPASQPSLYCLDSSRNSRRDKTGPLKEGNERLPRNNVSCEAASHQSSLIGLTVAL